MVGSQHLLLHPGLDESITGDIIYLNLAGMSVIVLNSMRAAEELMVKRMSVSSRRSDRTMINELWAQALHVVPLLSNLLFLECMVPGDLLHCNRVPTLLTNADYSTKCSAHKPSEITTALFITRLDRSSKRSLVWLETHFRLL